MAEEIGAVFIGLNVLLNTYLVYRLQLLARITNGKLDRALSGPSEDT